MAEKSHATSCLSARRSDRHRAQTIRHAAQFADGRGGRFEPLGRERHDVGEVASGAGGATVPLRPLSRLPHIYRTWMLLTASRSRALVCAMLLLSCGNTRSSPDTSAADSGDPPDVGTSGAGGGNAGGGAGASVAPSGGTSTAGTSSGGSNAGATGGGSSSCLSPGLVKLSYASTAACSDQGRFSAVE